ncbi:InlB B-repeat-containing protein, partial [Peptoniphilus genitalis]|uniref:InlB B-repeat-containing protein n=1 Tax=Peptoniphilus genitalis TaxID=3036303 RepID=UPI0024AD5FFF
MLKGFYFTSIDYLVDKTKFADNFGGTNKLDYSMMSGWMNPNINGWTVFEKEYENNYKVPEGESYLIDVGTKPESNQIMIQIGDETRALYRKPQGYYNGYVTGKNGIDQIDEFAKGVYKFTLREGATIEKGQKIRILVPYVGDHPDTVNFLEANDGTDYNKGSAQLRLQKDRNINMHLYTDLPRGASFVLRYTLKGETEEKSLKLETPKVGTLWQYKDTDKVLTGLPNRSILSTGGNFYIDTTKLEPGKDIFVDAYDEKGNKLEDKTSYFRYSKVNKVSVHKDMTWVDYSDTSSILSINKSLYTPYQLLFTNDYAEGTDDFYKDPRAFTGTNENFMKDTKEFVGYTKYDGGKVRTLYEEGKVGKLYAKVEAAADEYTDKGEIKTDNSKKITIPKDHIFDAQFDGENKEYRAYEYKVYLTKMLPYHSEDKTEKSLTLLKDMKFVSNASDGSSLPSDLYETRVRARVLFDANTGKLTEGDKQVDKTVKIVPDNTKFYGEDGYAANGFEGANVEANTGDKFPEAPTHEGKNFLGWVTEAGKTALGNKAVVTADAFAKLSKDQIFTNETPVTKHLVVYAIYSDETAVTFDANQGKFTDGKDTTTVKVESGSVTKPADPTREGYEFKGWADKKDATAPTEGILDNVTAPKTVYAVWEKKADAELTLKNPTPVEVKDLKSLTSDEKDKVADAVIAANNTLGLAKADITVADDGTVTVKTKDGKTGTLASEKTVKQKEVQNNFNPPKEPVKVDNAKALTEDEIKQVKQAIKDANPERNFKDDEITVKPDGTVEINQAGKVGSFTPDQTVVQKDTILDLTAPEKTEVKDTTDLTQDERNKVAAAVKKANEGKLSAAAVVTVDNKGNVKVTDGTKTGKLEGKDTVKPFTRDGKKLNPPTQKVKVGDTNNLNETEKQAVKDAVKAANPELGFTDDEIQVDPNGTVTVPMGKSEASIPGTETVEEATDADKIIKLVAPAKTEVADKSHLTDDEKNAVIAAIKEANPSLKSEGYNIVVSDDGAVTVTQGTGDNQKVGQLSQADTVVEKLKAPKAPVGVKNPSNLTPEEKTAVEDAVKDANPNLPKDAKITVGNDGTVTVTDKDGKEIGTITADKTVKKAGAIVAPAEPVKVKDPSKLTDDEKKAVEDAVKKANPDLPLNATIEVGNDGTVTVTDKDGKELGKLTPAQTVKKADEAGTVVAPAEPVKVADPSNLTEPEKKAVEKAVKDAN